MAVPVYFDPMVLKHATGPGHPETATRVKACAEALSAAGFQLTAPPSPARTRAAIEAVHSPAYVRRFEEKCAVGAAAATGRPISLFDSPDNPISSESFGAAERAVGLVLAATDRVASGADKAVFVAVRPPGHHALAARAMGFCFFNTIAIAARDLVLTHGLSRVLVVDFDVHHGNGTQEIFWADGEVAYLSVHRFPFYPGTGAADEEGTGRGRGATVNVPMAEGSGDRAYVGGLVASLERLAERFRPEMILVSAGFDAHEADPLGGMRVTTDGYGRMTREIRDVASVFAKGRIVSLLEGGYDPQALGESAVLHASLLEAPD